MFQSDRTASQAAIEILMTRTRICSLLNISIPILQGGMLWIADAGLAAAVSGAGALGVISPLAGMELNADPVENLHRQINQVRALTNRPFGVNIPLDLDYSGLLIDAILKEKVGIAITAAGSPAHYTELLVNSGTVVLHVVGSVQQAKQAQTYGAKAVIASGYEAAGHLAFNATPLIALIPRMVDSVSIPVIAAGGICDGRAMAAAMALGAEGVQMGTRFVATDECIAHQNYKNALVRASESAITLSKRMPARCLRTPFTEKLIELESSNASAKSIQEFIGFRKSRFSQIDGDLSKGESFCGAAVGLVKEVIPVKEVIERILKDYHNAVAHMVSDSF